MMRWLYQNSNPHQPPPLAGEARRGSKFRLYLCLTACLISTLACSLTVKDDGSTTTDSGTGGDEVADAGGAPTVQIISPGSGQQIALGSTVDIQVVATDAVGVSRVQLSVGNRTSSTKSFPEAATTGEALLRWRPDREGTFELSVVAFRNFTPSAPATLTLQVVGRGDAITNPVTGQAQAQAAAGQCIGRVLIGNLRMRSGPGTSFSNLGNFNLNEQVTVLGQNAAGDWLKVRRSNSSENWVSNNPEWIELTGSCTGLSVVS